MFWIYYTFKNFILKCTYIKFITLQQQCIVLTIEISVLKHEHTKFGWILFLNCSWFNLKQQVCMGTRLEDFLVEKYSTNANVMLSRETHGSVGLKDSF